MRNAFLLTGLVFGWVSVGLQLYLIIANRVASLMETIVRFFSFFTILTNTLVALCFTFLLLSPGSYWGRFFSRPKTLIAVTGYIVMVGIVYNVILRFTWKPQGLQMIVDESLHTVIPLLFLLYWLLFAPKTGLQWRSVFPWLKYPLAYLVFILLRGALSGFYPYPFIDVGKLGYSEVLVNSVGLFFAFLLLSLLLVVVGRTMVKISQK